MLERRISKSVIRQKVTFYADSAVIRFDTYVDWKEHQHLLKVHFPVDIHTDEAAFDIQFGNLTRKIHATLAGMKLVLKAADRSGWICQRDIRCQLVK